MVWQIVVTEVQFESVMAVAPVFASICCRNSQTISSFPMN